MTRTLVILGLVTLVAACGGRGGKGSAGRSASPQSYSMFATGPVYQACLDADRKNASRALCGCIQASANQSFKSSEQARVVTFFKDPHQSQVTRQSDKASDERFWPRYRAWANSTTRTCS